MDINLLTTSGAGWFWDQYGKNITDKAIQGIKQEWKKINWPSAEAKYRARLKAQHSTTRLLGRPKPIDIEGIFTDVYILDQLTAFKKFDINQLQASNSADRKNLSIDDRQKRYPILDIILTDRNFALQRILHKANAKRLYILGKPGAGKTTLLKYLTIQACDGKISKTPIFIAIKEWADSNLELIPFIEKQFEICAFPDASPFVRLLLENDNTLILFDGLDEVNREGGKREFIINQINEFTKRYIHPQVCLTCRLASVDYAFTQFHYVEIADFVDEQVQIFVKKWFDEDKQRSDMFLKEFYKRENRPIRELSRTPLLLTLLCLGFDATLSFPARRVDLYRDAVDALLKRWDSSRGISRDSLYKNLSPIRKEQLLARIAAQNFTDGKYFIRQDILASQITKHLSELPHLDLGRDSIDGEAVLRTIEAQHGLLIERAQGIYSFSHLTFQEYFTAKYIIENAPLGTLEDLFEYASDPRWNEVFLLTASLLDNADPFFKLFLKKKDSIIQGGLNYHYLMRWVGSQTNSMPNSDSSFFIIVLIIAIVALFQKLDEGRSWVDKKVYNYEIDGPLLYDYLYNAEMVICLHKAKELLYRTGTQKIVQIDKLIDAAMHFTRVHQPRREHYFQFGELLDFIQNYFLSQHVFVFSKDVFTYDSMQNVLTVLYNSAAQFKLHGPRLSSSDTHILSKYIDLAELFVDCLQLSAVSNRGDLLKQFFSL